MWFKILMVCIAVFYMIDYTGKVKTKSVSGINIYVSYSTFSEVNKIHPCFILTPKLHICGYQKIQVLQLFFLSEHLICGKLAFQLLFTNLILVWAKHSITSLGISSGKADQSCLSFLILVSWWGKAFSLTVHNSLPPPKKNFLTTKLKIRLYLPEVVGK